MKAHINGITIEGTPEEIAEYQRIINRNNNVDFIKQLGTWWHDFPQYQIWHGIYPPPDTLVPRVWSQTGEGCVENSHLTYE